MIRANKHRIFGRIFNIYNKYLLKKFFNSIQLNGSSNFKDRNKNFPTIIFANHSNWWDGLISYFLSKEIFEIDSYVMMDIEQLQKHKFFSKLGAFSVDKSSPQAAYKSFQYSINLLKNSDKTLFIFPQGKMLPNDIRPLEFFSGLSKIITNLNNVNVFSLCLRFEYLMEQRADVFLKISPIEIKKEWNGKKLTNVLSNELTKNLDELKSEIIKSNFIKFERILTGKRSIDKK